MHLAVAVVEGIDNRTGANVLNTFWDDAWSGVNALGFDDARKHPYVDAWRQGFRELGVSMKRFPTSIEALLRRALKGGDVFRINPLVDFYNALSLIHVCPAGAFDLDVVDNTVALRMTRNTDSFQALDSDELIQVDAGEIAYASGDNVLTRHFMWRQSRLALVSERTRNVFLVSEIPGCAGAEVAQAMRTSMVDGLSRFFGRDCVSTVLSMGDSGYQW